MKILNCGADDDVIDRDRYRDIDTNRLTHYTPCTKHTSYNIVKMLQIEQDMGYVKQEYREDLAIPKKINKKDDL